MADMTPPAARPRSSGARACTIVAFVFAVIAILFFPVVFGPLAIILGIVGAVLGDKPLGWYAAGAGLLGMIIGMTLGYMLTR